MTWPFGTLPMFGHRIIYADPAWNFDGGGDRNAREHYACMSIADIQALPVGDLAARDCALFLWATDPLLDVAIETLRRWGFRYTSVAFHWAKRTKLDNGWHMGTGYGTRANVETCLFGTMGEVGLPQDRSVRRLIVEPLREHSRKPERVRADIERLYDGPYLELFARETRPGWSAWGNEIGKFDVVAGGAADGGNEARIVHVDGRLPELERPHVTSFSPPFEAHAAETAAAHQLPFGGVAG